MLYLFFLNKPFFWILIWILQIIGYFGIFRKMHLNRIYAITPFSAEKKIGDTMFQTRYAFWHPFLLALIFTAAGLYMNPFGQRVSPSQKLYGLIFLFFAFFHATCISCFRSAMYFCKYSFMVSPLPASRIPYASSLSLHLS